MSKTQSKLGVTVNNTGDILQGGFYDNFLLLQSYDSQTISATTTPAKILFTLFLTNDLHTPISFFTASTVNDNFTYVYADVEMIFEYSISYNQNTADSNIYYIQLYKNGTEIQNQLLTYNTTGTVDGYQSFSRTGSFDAATNDVFDFRVSVIGGTSNFIIEDLEVIIKPLSISL